MLSVCVFSKCVSMANGSCDCWKVYLHSSGTRLLLLLLCEVDLNLIKDIVWRNSAFKCHNSLFFLVYIHLPKYFQQCSTPEKSRSLLKVILLYLVAHSAS